MLGLMDKVATLLRFMSDRAEELGALQRVCIVISIVYYRLELYSRKMAKCSRSKQAMTPELQP